MLGEKLEAVLVLDDRDFVCSVFDLIFGWHGVVSYMTHP